MNKNNNSSNKQNPCIVAQATGPARGGVGVIRLSGCGALEQAKKLFRFKHNLAAVKSHRMYYGDVVNTKGEVLDDGYLVFFAGPHSYTGEDSVELNVHGNPVVMAHIIECFGALGVPMAKPGEFTQRAYLNDKLNLTQAEAVAEFIEATSLKASHYAKQRLQGVLSDRIEALYILALEVLAECEADIDFPDENLPIADKGHILNKLEQVIAELEALSKTYNATHKIHDGFKVVLLGEPNVGKSSLFNAILNEERALVSDIPGTTRDRLRENIILAGCPVQFIDTAGLREQSDDKIEQAGMALSLEELKRADLVCFLSSTQDAQLPAAVAESLLFEQGSVWRVLSKLDLNPTFKDFHDPKTFQFAISAHSKENLHDFIDALEKKVTQELDEEKVLIGNLRQKSFVDRSRESFLSAKKNWLRGQAEEFVALELREGMKHLMTLLGKEDITEEILDAVFSKFCVGK